MSSSDLNKFQIIAILLAAYLLTLCAAHAQTQTFYNIKTGSIIALDAANALKVPRGDGTWQSIAGVSTNTYSASGVLTLSIVGNEITYGLSTNGWLFSDPTITNGLVTGYTGGSGGGGIFTNGLLKSYDQANSVFLFRGLLYGAASGGGTLTQSGGTLTFAPADLSSFVTASITNSLASTNWAKATFAPIAVTNVDLTPYALTSSLGTLAYSNATAFVTLLNGLYAPITVTNVSLTPYALTTTLLSTASVLQSAINSLPTSNAVVSIVNATNATIQTQLGGKAATNQNVSLFPNDAAYVSGSFVSNNFLVASGTNGSVSGIVTGINTIAYFGGTGRLTNTTSYTTNLVSATGTYAGMSVGTATFASFANVQTQTSGVNAVNSGTLNFITSTGSGLTRTLTNNGGAADLILNTDGSLMKTGSLFVSGGSFTAAANGGTLTIAGVPLYTNSSAGAALVYNTRYGALVVSNQFGYRFVSLPNLSSIDTTNDTSGLTKFFTNSVDVTGATYVNTNGWTYSWESNSCNMVISCTPENVSQARLWLQRIPAAVTNQRWRATVYFSDAQLILPAANSPQSAYGLAAVVDTNSTVSMFGFWGEGNATSSAIRPYIFTTPTSAFSYDTQFTGNSITMLPTIMSLSQFALRCEYFPNGQSNVLYIAQGKIGQNFTFQQTAVKTNLPNPQYIGIIQNDRNSGGLQLKVRAFVFEH